MERVTVVWFREDLRLDDNPALGAAAERGEVIPLWINEPENDARGWAPGEASRWWLHHGIEALADAMSALGGRLVLRSGRPLQVIEEIVAASGASAVFWNRRYTPAGTEVDRSVKVALKEGGVVVRSFRANVLWEPWEIATQQGEPYRVFSPFWRAVEARDDRRDQPLDAPAGIVFSEQKLCSEDLSSFGFLPSRDWANAFAERWTPGERGARDKLDRFIEEAVNGYKEDRDFPGLFATSRLSPHLHFGEISPARIVRAVRDSLGQGETTRDHQHFIREVGWREFAHHLLYHFPETVDRPLRREFEAFPWTEDREALSAWQRGLTGYPLVDAGMRELWATGWMHNRVRMVVASFLVKHLLLPWQEGARWFWETLVDADLANNTLGWQWAGGCGADAAPYFRVFNPTLQARKFDPRGDYTRRWVPELANLPDEHLHAPFEAPEGVLEGAGVVLGETYPKPLVDHREARDRALGAWSSFREARG